MTENESEKPELDAEDSKNEVDSAEEKLKKEEQMARYEESLKDSDWGHQPC